MAEQVFNYKCPACTGPLHFDGASGKLVCDYCGSSYGVAEMEALYAGKEEAAAQASAAEQGKPAAQATAENDWDYSGTNSDWGADGAHMRSYTCPSCAAELICDDTTAATSCPYCGNPTIVPGQFAGVLRPDLILPFRLKKEDAVQALRKHYQDKPLLPKTFSEENHIQEIKGVYVPFWLFSGDVDVDMDLSASTVRVHEEFDERVTETAHFRLHREGTVSFDRIPADGSSKMPDGHMDSIEPFDYSELKPFSVAYLPGFLAEKYDVSAQECAPRADERAKNTALAAVLNDSVQYTGATPIRTDYRMRRGKVQYALLPVWMLSTKWQGKNYLFAMNGQTGRLVGDLPTSTARFWGWFAKIAIPSTVVLSVLSYLVTHL